MKRIVILICLVGLSSAQAQWVDPAPVGGDIYYMGGNVGVGITSPFAKVQIVGTDQEMLRIGEVDSPGDYLRIINGTGRVNEFVPFLEGRKSSDNREALILAGSIPASMDNGTNAVLRFDARQLDGPVAMRPLFHWTNYSDIKMTLSANGNLGIGVTAPGEKLEVNGAIRLKPTEPVYFLGGSSDPNYLIQSGEWDDGMKYKHWTSHQFFTNGQEKIRISKEGNLLIGKTSQTNTAYRLDVAGSVRTNEIVVNTTGADYVFETGYKLKGLREVESFIRENGHLPGIPTAKDMQENGMSVGELNTKLLEKVEELTLYLIQQEEKLQEQQKMILELQRRMN